MENIFYYIGIIVLIDLVIQLFKKQNIKNINERINMINNSNSLMNGELGGLNESLEIINKKKFKLLKGLLVLGWLVGGAIVSDQKLIFILFICVMFSNMSIIKKVPENKRHMVENINIIIRILIMLVIIYNHFFKY